MKILTDRELKKLLQESFQQGKKSAAIVYKEPVDVHGDLYVESDVYFEKDVHIDGNIKNRASILRSIVSLLGSSKIAPFSHMDECQNTSIRWTSALPTVMHLSNLLASEPLSEHAAVLSYEAGAVLEQAMYLTWAERFGGLDDKDKKIIRGKMKSELMDVMAQAWTLCVKLGEDPVEWLELGCEKAVSAITSKRSGQPKDGKI